jgi:hypothetical protein
LIILFSVCGLNSYGAMEYEREESIGYITGEQAALQFFQKGVTAAFSIGFDGLMDGVVGSFKGFGILAEGLENLGKSIIKNNFNSWVNAFELDGKGGWDWNGEAYQESAWGKGALGMYASAFVTPMAQRGATDFFTQDGTGLDLTGNVFGIKNLAALGNTIGGLTGEFASYLFDGEFSVNVLNLSDLTGGALNHGLIEFSLTGQNRFGGGGANVGGFTGILNSLKAIRSDAIYVASHKLGGNQGLAEINATNRLGYAGEEDLAKRLVSGDLKIQWSDLDDAHGKFLQGQEGTIHISTAYANNDAESASKMAAVIGHEATHEQGERREAFAHLEGGSIYRTLMQQGRATDSDFLNGIMNELMREENYLENDSSADFWRLKEDGSLEFDGDGWLKDEDGRYILTNGMRLSEAELAQNPPWLKNIRIGAKGIETGLLNILFGGTSREAYSSFTDDQIGLVQTIMVSAGLEHSHNSNNKSWLWSGEQQWEVFSGLIISSNLSTHNRGRSISFDSLNNLSSGSGIDLSGVVGYLSSEDQYQVLHSAGLVEAESYEAWIADIVENGPVGNTIEVPGRTTQLNSSNRVPDWFSDYYNELNGVNDNAYRESARIARTDGRYDAYILGKNSSNEDAVFYFIKRYGGGTAYVDQAAQEVSLDEGVTAQDYFTARLAETRPGRVDTYCTLNCGLYFSTGGYSQTANLFGWNNANRVSDMLENGAMNSSDGSFLPVTADQFMDYTSRGGMGIGALAVPGQIGHVSVGAGRGQNQTKFGVLVEDDPVAMIPYFSNRGARKRDGYNGANFSFYIDSPEEMNYYIYVPNIGGQ